jgi:polysaccharide pyruvyl transferase WcaK-like protein
VAIWGHYHGRNLGDDVVVSAIAQNLRARCPDIELVGISLSPQDTRQRHGVEAIPLRWSSIPAEGQGAAGPSSRALKRWLDRPLRDERVRSAVRGLRHAVASARAVLAEPAFLWRASQELRDIDLVVVAGSGPVSDDWKGAWSHPYTIAKWELLARLRGVPFAFLAVGAGPLDGRLSRALVRGPLGRAAHRSFRDDASAGVVRSLRVPGPLTVVPDLAISHPAPQRAAEQPSAPTGIGAPGDQVTVGLGPIPYYDKRYWPDSDDERYADYLAKVADFAEWVIRSGRRLNLLYSHTTADPLVCDDLVQLLAGRLTEEELAGIGRPVIWTVEDLFAAIGECDYVVAGRFHCILLPYLTGRLAVGMAYHPKTFALMEYMGQADLCVDIETFTAQQLVEAAQAIEESRDVGVKVVAERLPALQAVLGEQYDSLLSVAETRAAASAAVRG